MAVTKVVRETDMYSCKVPCKFNMDIGFTIISDKGFDDLRQKVIDYLREASHYPDYDVEGVLQILKLRKRHTKRVYLTRSETVEEIDNGIDIESVRENQ